MGSKFAGRQRSFTLPERHWRRCAGRKRFPSSSHSSRRSRRRGPAGCVPADQSLHTALGRRPGNRPRFGMRARLCTMDTTQGSIGRTDAPSWGYRIHRRGRGQGSWQNRNASGYRLKHSVRWALMLPRSSTCSPCWKTRPTTSDGSEHGRPRRTGAA